MEPPNCVKMDHPKRLTAGAKMRRCLHGGGTFAWRAINMVTQRCLSGIHTSARWHVTQPAEIDATAVSFDGAKSTEVD